MSAVGPGIALYIPRNTKQEGQLSVQGRIRIDGHFIGSLYTESGIEVGPEGFLEGSADAAAAEIHGRFKGELLIHGLCILREGAQFEGLLDTALAQMESGCQFKGEARIVGRT